MTLKEIEKKAYTLEGKTIDPLDKATVNKNILKILENCINKNINLNINENDFVEIINIYYDVYNKYDKDFFKNISSLSINEINFFKVINKLNN